MLDYERSLFFSTPYTLGQTHFLQEVQTTPTCNGFLTGTDGPQADKTKSETFTYKDVPCSENRRWIVGKVMYAVLNIQGSCDNLCDDYPDPVEYAARIAPDIAWMQGTFQTAIEQGCVAVMFISWADSCSSRCGDLSQEEQTLAKTFGSRRHLRIALSG
jgi:hypothetical protein